MTLLERNDLHAAIELRYQDNTTGDITPKDLRDGLHELVDSAFLPASDELPLPTAQLLGLDPGTGEFLVLLSPSAPTTKSSYVLAEYAAGTTSTSPLPASASLASRILRLPASAVGKTLCLLDANGLPVPLLRLLPTTYTQAQVNALLSDYVTLHTAQTVFAPKKHVENLSIIQPDSDYDAFADRDDYAVIRKSYLKRYFSTKSITRYGYSGATFETLTADADGFKLAVSGAVGGATIRVNTAVIYFNSDVDFASTNGTAACKIYCFGTTFFPAGGGTTFRSAYSGTIACEDAVFVGSDYAFTFDAASSQTAAIFHLCRSEFVHSLALNPTVPVDVVGSATLIAEDCLVSPDFRFSTDASSKIVLRGKTNGTIGSGPNDIWPLGTVDERLSGIWEYVGDPAQQNISLGRLDLSSNTFDPNGLSENNIFYAAAFVSNNAFGNDFSGNAIYGELRNCTFGNFCGGNVFRPSVLNCILGNKVSNCYFDVGTQYVQLGDFCERVNLYNCGGTAQQPFVVPAGTKDAEYRNNQLVTATGAGSGSGTAYTDPQAVQAVLANLIAQNSQHQGVQVQAQNGSIQLVAASQLVSRLEFDKAAMGAGNVLTKLYRIASGRTGRYTLLSATNVASLRIIKQGPSTSFDDVLAAYPAAGVLLEENTDYTFTIAPTDVTQGVTLVLSLTL